ncbi:glycosyltransferase family 4 protein [Marixanthomonas sp. SCSIO 43207]|uniref:glycosyltransferase family 4 protein n=1 Tax=Marixanthomonas sp. SCSIO 43207 TaxID=2779360 RepID=UPI001CA8A7D2|nr:glycosyltransferase family 4 protein [Marixanthomonas sp. SCSIO 43207]UAB81224.1 glycosyltransferase family 4 protein [Marixanthomonas sp. SCSIO 43207]
MPENHVIKIVHLFDEYPVFYQPYIPPVINKLRDNPNLDIEVVVFNGTKSKEVSKLPNYYKRKVIEKIHYFFCKSNLKLNLAEIQFLKKNVAIVHIQHSYLFSKVLGLLNMDSSQRPKIVITLRGGDTYVKPWVNKKWRNFYKKYGNKVDSFVVMSNHQKKYLNNKWKVPENRIKVIPISFGEKFSVSPKRPDKKIIRIASVFRMCWEKNIDGNLRIIKELIQNGFPVRYDLYGDGPDLGQVWYLIDKYKLTNYVHCHGRISHKELKMKLINSDFLIQLSHSEAFPTSVLEAQSIGIPALVSNAGGLPESIIPNKTGYSIEAFDTIKGAYLLEKLWTNSDLYFQFSLNAISNSHKKYSTEKEIEKLNKLYKTII